MCYYATTDFACGDWKWGNMKLRCPRQHRMGETCGAKLIHLESVTKSPELCRTCQDIETKKRRLKKEQDNILRWSKEGDKFRASIEKAQGEAQKLEQAIRVLYHSRPKVVMEMNGQARGLGPGQAPEYASYPSPGQISLPSIGHLDGSANRHAPAAQGGYAGTYASSEGNRHTPGYSSGGANFQSSRHSTSPTAPPSNRHSAAYHSGYGGGR